MSLNQLDSLSSAFCTPSAPPLTYTFKLIRHLSLAEAETRLILLICELNRNFMSGKTEVMVDAFASKLKAQGVAIQREDNASRLHNLLSPA